MDLPLRDQSVPIIVKVFISNPAHCEVYSIQHYMKKFVSVVRQVSHTNKTERHDIISILLKVALNTITLTLTLGVFVSLCLIHLVYSFVNILMKFLFTTVIFRFHIFLLIDLLSWGKVRQHDIMYTWMACKICKADIIRYIF